MHALFPSTLLTSFQEAPSRCEGRMQGKHWKGAATHLALSGWKKHATLDNNPGMGCLPLARFGDLGPDGPVVFGLEGGDELVALYAEEQRGRLAGPVADHRRIQIAILALQPVFTRL